MSIAEAATSNVPTDSSRVSQYWERQFEKNRTDTSLGTNNDIVTRHRRLLSQVKAGSLGISMYSTKVPFPGGRQMRKLHSLLMFMLTIDFRVA
jgi:hypothetical protein